MCSHHEKSGPWATTIQTTPSAPSTVSRGGSHHLDPTKPRPPLVTSQFYWSTCSLKNQLRGEEMKERVSGCSYCECTRSLWKQAPVVWGSDINNHIASVYFWMILNVWGLKKKKWWTSMSPWQQLGSADMTWIKSERQKTWSTFIYKNTWEYKSSKNNRAKNRMKSVTPSWGRGLMIIFF